MAKAKATPTPKAPKLEFEPDAWERFESLVKSAAKMGPRPHAGAAHKSKKPAIVEKPLKSKGNRERGSRTSR